MAATFMIVILVTAGPALLGWIAQIKSPGTSAGRGLLSVSAAAPVFFAMDRPYHAAAANAQYFWWVLGATHALSWVCLGWASFHVRRAWQDRPAIGWRANWQDRLRAWQFGGETGRVELRRRLLGENPILWLIGRDRLKPMSVFTALLVFGLIWLLFFIKWGRNVMLDPTAYFLTAYTLHSVLKLWLASEACRPLAEDRRTGALELVLSTPLSVDEILTGAILALKRQFAWAAAFVLCAELLLLLPGTGDQPFDSDWFLLCFGLMVVFVADLYTLAWVGLWLGLTAKKTSRAVTGNVARVLVLPWAIFLFGITGLAMFSWHGADPNPTTLLAGGFALALINDAVLFAWAKTNLRERLRLVATQRFDAKPAVDAIPSEIAVDAPSTGTALAR